MPPLSLYAHSRLNTFLEFSADLSSDAPCSSLPGLQSSGLLCHEHLSTNPPVNISFVTHCGLTGSQACAPASRSAGRSFPGLRLRLLSPAALSLPPATQGPALATSSSQEHSLKWKEQLSDLKAWRRSCRGGTPGRMKPFLCGKQPLYGAETLRTWHLRGQAR